MYLALVVVLDVGNGRAVLFLPADCEEAVAERRDLDIHDLGPGERAFLDLELQPGRREQRQADLEGRVGDIHLQSDGEAVHRHVHCPFRAGDWNGVAARAARTTGATSAPRSSIERFIAAVSSDAVLIWKVMRATPPSTALA